MRPDRSVSSAQPPAGGRGLHPGAPDNRAGRDETAIRGHAARLDLFHHVPRQHGDALAFQSRVRVGGERLRKGAEDSRRRFDQKDIGGPGIDAAEVAGEGVTGELRDGARHLHSRRAAADDHGCHQRLLLLGVGRHLGFLERHQETRANLASILDRLQAGRDLRPVVVPEVAVLGAGRNDQTIVCHGIAVGRQHGPAAEIDARDFRQHHVDVPIATQDLADRLGDIRRRQGGGGHLVQQRHEQVVVLPVDDGDADIGSAELGRAGQPGKAGADDDDRK